ncbi:MAG TPA: ABC transporter permease [Lachnospiraceae bacterium]
MIEYLVKHSDMFLEAFLEHLWIVLVTLLISVLAAGLISFVLLQSKRAADWVLGAFSAIYSIPSLALFSLLIPFMGLGNATAILVLCIYNQYLLIRNIITGMHLVDKNMIEAAVGMGMTRGQVVMKVQIPLALPAIVAGIRLAIISTTGIATIAATINAGGLGSLLFSGLRTMNIYKILWATVLCVLITFLSDVILKRVEKSLRHA